MEKNKGSCRIAVGSNRDICLLNYTYREQRYQPCCLVECCTCYDYDYKLKLANVEAEYNKTADLAWKYPKCQPMIRQFDKDLDKIHDVHRQVFSLYKCIGVLEESIRSEKIIQELQQNVLDYKDKIKQEIKQAYDAESDDEEESSLFQIIH